MKAEDIIETGFDDHVDLEDRYITYNKDGDVVTYFKEPNDYPDASEQDTNRYSTRDDYSADWNSDDEEFHKTR